MSDAPWYRRVEARADWQRFDGKGPDHVAVMVEEMVNGELDDHVGRAINALVAQGVGEEFHELQIGLRVSYRQEDS